MRDREDERILLPILLPILLIVGLVCCFRPEFFVKRPGLRLWFLFRLIPERHHAGFVRFLGVTAVFAAAVGLIQLARIW